jgi:hypothetical protein
MVFWKRINRERAIARIKTIIERIEHDAFVSAITADLRQLHDALQRTTVRRYCVVDPSILQDLKARFDAALKKYDAPIKLVAANAAIRSAATKFGGSGTVKFGSSRLTKSRGHLLVCALITDTDGMPLPPAPAKTPHKEACDAIVRRLM